MGAGLLIAQQVAARATRDAFYLSQFPVTTLPLVSGASALLSLLGVAVFARGMARLSPVCMVPRTLVVSSVLLLGEWALSLAAPAAAAALLYFHVGLFGATLVSGFWSLVTERFDPHTARRAMGLVGTGASLGGVTGGVVTWAAAAVVPVPAMLVVLALMTLFCVPMARALAPPPQVAAATPREATESGAWAGSSPGWKLLGRVPYLRDLAVLVGVCALMEALLDYTFNAAAAARYARGGALISFFALFHTAAGLLTLAVQATLARRALQRLGLARTLAVQPAAVALLGALVTAAPRATAVILLRLSEVVLRNSLFRSGYELLYTPVAPERKRPTKALVDVACDRVGTVVGSAMVALVLVLWPASPTRVLVGLASACSALMLALAVRFHRAYLSALVESLRLGVVRLESEDLVDATTRLAVESVAVGESRAPLPVPAAETDAIVRRLVGLRSGDLETVRRALAESDLDAGLVGAAAGLLARDEVFGDALTALRRVATRSTGQLVDVMLDPAQEPVVRRRIPRVLAAAPSQRAADGLMLALRDERFDLRYRAAQALVRLRQRNASLQLDPAAVFAVARQELERARPSSRIVDHVFTVLSLALEREPLEISLRAVRGSDPGLRGTALEYLDNVLPGAIREGIWPWLGIDRPAASGRARDEMRDELLRSSSRWGRSASRRRDAVAGPPS